MTSLCWWVCSIFQKFKLNIAISCGHWTMSLVSPAHGTFIPQNPPAERASEATAVINTLA